MWHNEGNLGICFVGTDKFTKDQFSSAKAVIKTWLLNYNIPLDQVFAHYQFDTAVAQGKTCPNMKIEDLREWLLGNDLAIEKYILGVV